MTRGSRLLDRASDAGSPQDPYSFRCIPQVHGAIAAAIDHVEETLELELVATVDNPLVLPEDGFVGHCGHFHGQALALTGDYLAASLVGLANVSHARSSLLLRGRRGLPPMLRRGEGEMTGLMMLETVSASLTAKARAMASPLSTQNIAASPLQEDHVSMAWEAARRSHRLSKLVCDVLAIEAVEAVEAVRLRGSNQLGDGSNEVFEALDDAQSEGNTLSERISLVRDLLLRGGWLPL